MKIILGGALLITSYASFAEEVTAPNDHLGTFVIEDACWVGESAKYKARLGVAYGPLDLLVIETDPASFSEQPPIGKLFHARVDYSHAFPALVVQNYPTIRLTVDLNFLGAIFIASKNSSSDTIKFYNDSIRLPAGNPMASPDLTRTQIENLVTCFEQNYSY